MVVWLNMDIAIGRWFLASGIKILLIIFGTWVGLRIAHIFIRRVLKTVIEKTYEVRDHIAIGKRTDTLESIIFSTLRVIVWILTGLIVLSELGVNIGPLLAAAGVVGIALGFGGQYLIRDLIAGLFIILEDQYRKGDVVKVAGIGGLVQDMTLRKTVLRDLDGIEHHIPNGEITVTSNMTKLWSRAHLNIGVSYDTNLEHAIDVLNRIGNEMAEDPKWKDDIIKPVQVVGVDDFAESAVMIKILGDTKPIRQWDVMREMRKRIKIAFDKEGIEIPFPHRTIVYKEQKK